MASTLPSRGEARSPSLVPSPSRRDRALIASCIVLITALAWAYLVHLNRHMTSPSEGDTMMAADGAERRLVRAPTRSPAADAPIVRPTTNTAVHRD